jgi:hypothetical protein
MNAESFAEAVHAINTRTAQRARRLAYALMLLRSGMHPRDVRRIVVQRFRVSRMCAWCDVDAACDMAGPL